MPHLYVKGFVERSKQRTRPFKNFFCDLRSADEEAISWEQEQAGPPAKPKLEMCFATGSVPSESNNNWWEREIGLVCIETCMFGDHLPLSVNRYAADLYPATSVFSKSVLTDLPQHQRHCYRIAWDLLLQGKADNKLKVMFTLPPGDGTSRSDTISGTNKVSNQTTKDTMTKVRLPLCSFFV